MVDLEKMTLNKANTINQRFETAHERAFPKRGESNYRISPDLLREYLDVQWWLQYQHKMGRI